MTTDGETRPLSFTHLSAHCAEESKRDFVQHGRRIVEGCDRACCFGQLREVVGIAQGDEDAGLAQHKQLAHELSLRHKLRRLPGGDDERVGSAGPLCDVPRDLRVRVEGQRDARNPGGRLLQARQ